MERLGRDDITRALESLANELGHLPSRELKAQYAFLDLWEALHAS